MPGKFIDIEGGDSCGKATQTKLLISSLVGSGYEVSGFSFPRYDKHFGKLISFCWMNLEVFLILIRMRQRGFIVWIEPRQPLRFFRLLKKVLWCLTGSRLKFD